MTGIEGHRLFGNALASQVWRIYDDRLDRPGGAVFSEAGEEASRHFACETCLSLIDRVACVERQLTVITGIICQLMQERKTECRASTERRFTTIKTPRAMRDRR